MRKIGRGICKARWFITLMTFAVFTSVLPSLLGASAEFQYFALEMSTVWGLGWGAFGVFLDINREM